MCEKLTSHLFSVSMRKMLIHTINSHSETRRALGIPDTDYSVVEVEWREGRDKPDIRFDASRADNAEQLLIQDWYAEQFPAREDMITHCVARCLGGDLYLSGCDLSKLAKLELPKEIGGYLYLSGCDLSKLAKLELPNEIGGYLDLSGCDLSNVNIPNRFHVIL